MEHNPFNGDTYIGLEIRELVKKWGIKQIIETGTWSAHSTREFVKICPNVITIDPTWEHLIEEFGPNAIDDLKKLGICPILDDTSKCLIRVIEENGNPPILFYLDAHGGGANGSNVNPFLDELDQITYCDSCEDNCVIAVHDFQVPGKPWGYNGGDWGKGWEPLSYELIKRFLPEIYPKGHEYHYNENAVGLQRGIIYIYPKEVK